MLRAVRWRHSSDVIRIRLWKMAISVATALKHFFARDSWPVAVYFGDDTNEWVSEIRMYERRASQSGEENNSWITTGHRFSSQERFLRDQVSAIDDRQYVSIAGIESITAASSIATKVSDRMYFATIIAFFLSRI